MTQCNLQTPRNNTPKAFPNVTDGLNIFYSRIKYIDKDWVRCKVRHYPLQKEKEELQKQENVMLFSDNHYLQPRTLSIHSYFNVFVVRACGRGIIVT